MIPAEAVEAAVREVDRVLDGDLVGGAADTLVRVILEAAAPHMLADACAEAWEEGRQANDFEVSIGFGTNPYKKETA